MVAVPVVPASRGALLEDRYRLDEPIAAGGMGEVWQATDLVLDRPVAVKLLRPGFAGQEEGLARFRAEARHAGVLSHPGIAKIYDYREGDPPYLVMELADGPSLARLLDEGPADPALTLSLIAQAARALQAAHEAGLVHRDIKPGNILLSQGRHVKITDFGIAYAAGSAPLTRPGVLLGTPAYLAPERALGAPATPAADLYALGIVAYQCLTGRVPFDGEPLAVALAHRERPLPPLPPAVPAEVAALVADLTAKDPSARPASAAEVAERAEHLRAALTATGPVRRRRHDRKPGTLPTRAAVVLAAITTIAAGGWVMTGMHGARSAHPQPGSPAVVHQPSSSHPVYRRSPARDTSGASQMQAPGQGRRPHASRRPPAPSATPTPDQTPAPSRSSTPTGTATPTGSATASGTPTPSGTPAGTSTPTPSPSQSASQSQSLSPAAVPAPG
jgi:serine/threonine-protein kinase